MRGRVLDDTFIPVSSATTQDKSPTGVLYSLLRPPQNALGFLSPDTLLLTTPPTVPSVTSFCTYSLAILSSCCVSSSCPSPALSQGPPPCSPRGGLRRPSGVVTVFLCPRWLPKQPPLMIPCFKGASSPPATPPCSTLKTWAPAPSLPLSPGPSQTHGCLKVWANDLFSASLTHSASSYPPCYFLPLLPCLHLRPCHGSKCVTSQISISSPCSHLFFYPPLTLVPRHTCPTSPWPSPFCAPYLPTSTAPSPVPSLPSPCSPANISNHLPHLPLTAPSRLLRVSPRLLRAATDAWYFVAGWYRALTSTSPLLCLAVLASHKLAPLDDYSPNLPNLLSSKSPPLANLLQRR